MFVRVTTVLLVLLIAAVSFAQPNPELTVSLSGHGTWVFVEPESDFVVVQPTSGIPIEFTWEADASVYGGSVAGYRYGWDLQDPNNASDPGWATSGFVSGLLGADPVDFLPSLHTFHVAVIDEAGSVTLAAFLVDVVSPVSSRTTSWDALKSIYR